MLNIAVIEIIASSTAFYVFTLYDLCMSLNSQLQHIVALSIIEFEYIVATKATKEALWIRSLINTLGGLSDNVIAHSNSQSAIHLCKNLVFHKRSKYIDIKLHFIGDIVSHGLIKFEKVHSAYNPTDIGTKVLPLVKFRNCLILLNIGKDKTFQFCLKSHCANTKLVCLFCKYIWHQSEGLLGILIPNKPQGDDK